MYKSLFASSFLSGVMISIGGCILLSTHIPVVGSIFFSLGLLTILTYQLSLFTGKVGYLDSLDTLSKLVDIYFFNIIGTLVSAILIKNTHLPISQYATQLIMKKEYLITNLPFFQILIAGIFCGILMYIACEAYNKYKNNPVTSTIIVMLCVSVFICCGFEHCIADSFYLFVADTKYSPINLTIFLAIVTLGNSIGSICFHRILLIAKK